MKVRVNATYTASFVVEVGDDLDNYDVFATVEQLPYFIVKPSTYKVELTDWDVTNVNA